MTDANPADTRPALTLEQLLEEGGNVSYRRYVVLAIRNTDDGPEQIQRVGDRDFASYANALRELERQTGRFPGAWITEVYYQFDLEDDRQRDAFVAMFRDSEREGSGLQ